MFRIGFKLPCNGLNRVKRHGYSTIYLTTRKYETRSRIKCEPEGRLCKDVKLMSRFSGLKYSTGSPKSEKSRGSGGLLTLGALTLGTIGILTYAKQDPEFRKTLEEWIPGSKSAIEIIFQEDGNYFQFLTDFFKSMNQTISDLISSEEPKKEEKPAKLDPPKPAFEPLVAKKEPPVKKPHTEIRISNDRGGDVQVVPVIEKPAPPPKNIPVDLLPANLVELEHHSGQAASRAISAYKTASHAIEDYNKDVVRIVEGNGDTIGENVWERLKDATQKRKEALRGAEEHAKDAVDSLQKLYASIDDPKFQAPELTKTIAKQNIKKIVNDVDQAKEQFENHVKSANVTERYWKQVAKARKTFEEELEILFPNVNIADKKLSVDEESFDLFVLHMYNKVNYLQQELEKLQTIDEMKIKAALRSHGDDNERAKIDALVSTESNKAKLALHDEFSKKILAEKRRFEDEMRTQLKLQAQIHSDHLRDALQQKQRETERIVNRALSERAEAESNKYKLQLASVVGRVQGLEAALKARMEEDKSASNAQLLWSACQALARAVKVAPHGATGNEAVRPLQPEITAISKAAPASDPLVAAVINGIPKEASQRGVFTEDVLRERFLKVENMARRLALVPEGGAALPIYLLSYLQSFLLVKAISPIPKAELADEPIDPEELGTYDVLQRARYWLDRGDFKMTLRYLNLLKGASRSVATQWMDEARILLETQQAVDTLVAYAGAAGLVFLGGGDTAGKHAVSK